MNKIKKRNIRVVIGTVFALPILIFATNLIVGNYINLSVISPSMVPTLNVGDRIIATKKKSKEDLSYHVVIFNRPDTENRIVKRAIAVGPSTVEIKNRQVYINGKREKYTFTEFGLPNRTYDVPKNKVFLMGDNRNESYDSTDYGPIDINVITHVARFKYWPLSQINFVR